MQKTLIFLLYLLVMAGTTYLIRLLPILFIRKKIKNRFIRSFLYYIPYAVLTVMTVPAIFFSTDYLLSAILGTVVAVILACFRKGLVTVASGAVATVLAVELIITYIVPIFT